MSFFVTLCTENSTLSGLFDLCVRHDTTVIVPSKEACDPAYYSPISELTRICMDAHEISAPSVKPIFPTYVLAFNALKPHDEATIARLTDPDYFAPHDPLLFTAVVTPPEASQTRGYRFGYEIGGG